MISLGRRAELHLSTVTDVDVAYGPPHSNE